MQNTTEYQQLNLFDQAYFDGSDYIPEWDDKRLTGQIKRVYVLMIDGKWRSLGEIETATGDPQASISAQLRHLRKKRFGSHTVNKRRRGERENGLFEYQLLKQQ
jgi:hypothetical protein